MLTKRREHLINYNLMRENKKRRRWDYEPGQKVLKKIHDPTKLGKRHGGPFEILGAHVDRTVTIELRNDVTERINIRQITPYER